MRALRLLAFGVILASCERFGVKLGPPAPTTPEAVTPIGLDARPVNPACKAGPKPQTTGKGLIAYESVTSATLISPVEVTVHDGKTYVLEQGGKVVRIDATTASTVLDVSSVVFSGGEAGLLGIAFHPSFATNGFVYLYYTVPYPTQPPPAGIVFQSLLVRYHSADGGLTFEPGSAKPILTVDQPFANHNGGTIAFGKDGFLYWGLGDGGSGGDPNGNGQNKNVLLGKMLRIDVDGGDPYAIPSTNPFAAGGGRGEIYAYGLRNPYRFRFDDVTGDLWVGDVGQDTREEIDKVTLGGNFGWNVREGKICYNATTCPTAGFVDPIVDHPRSEASSITGGVVYRGTGLPALTGKYIYGDFAQRTFWAIPIDQPAPTPQRLDGNDPSRPEPSAFALDANGEILVADYEGHLVRLVPGPGTHPAPPEMPASLRATGCVDENDPKKPASGLFPYDVNVGQWLDGATATRAFSVPADGKLRGATDGRLALPTGSIAMRTISTEGRAVETQLLLHRTDASWDAYAYAWSDDQSDATLVTTKTVINLPSGRTHTIDDAATCIMCHNADNGTTIGIEAAQIDRDDADFGGRKGNPLATLEKLEMIEIAIPQDSYVPLVRQGTADARGRSYLHANCAFCHRGGDDQLDLRFGKTLFDMHVCADIVPGVPNQSILWQDMQKTGAGRMPPVGSSTVDPTGTANVADWIGSLSVCP